MDWYNSLTDYYSGAPEDFWDVLSDLCGQNGVTCDDSTPYQRIIKFLNFFFIFFFLFSLFSFFKYWNREMGDSMEMDGMKGTIPTQFGNLASLQNL